MSLTIAYVRSLIFNRSFLSIATSNKLFYSTSSKDDAKQKKKIDLNKKTPKGKFDYEEFDEPQPSYNEKEPLPQWPEGVNPKTGEIGGPKGPEPTRFGDWERKGRCTDF
jgi:hypothetical protein